METHVADTSGEIIFDTTSGISLEEQEEILAGINAMAAGNRLSKEAAAIKPKKRGFLFPLTVNITALLLLGFGLAALFLLHGRDEQGIRADSAVLGVTERKLIQEIRIETNRRIQEKESEISGILSKLETVDSEYRELQVSVENLTEEQKERAASLLLLQEEYRSTLSVLEEERTRILEESRMREIALRTQAEERARALSSQVEQGQANLSAAMEELARLSGERERAALVESQMTGYYAIVGSHLEAGAFDAAVSTLEEMKLFLDAPSLRGIRSLDEKRQTHMAAIAAMEALAGKLRLSGSGAAAGTEEAVAVLEAEKAALEQRVLDQERAIETFSADGSEQSRMIAESTAAIADLNLQINTLEQQVEALNTRYDIAAGIASNTEAELSTRLDASEAAVSELRGQVSARDGLLNSIPQVVEQAIEVPSIQNLLGPGARQGLIQTIQQAIEEAIR